MIARLKPCATLCLAAVALSAPASSKPAVDEFDETYARLRQGQVYSRDVPRGVVHGSRRTDAGEYFYTLDIYGVPPENRHSFDN